MSAASIAIFLMAQGALSPVEGAEIVPSSAQRAGRAVAELVQEGGVPSSYALLKPEQLSGLRQRVRRIRHQHSAKDHVFQYRVRDLGAVFSSAERGS